MSKDPDTLTVEPVEGHTAVREDNPRHRITERTVVPNTAYYRRMIVKGGLKLAPARSERASKEG